MDKIAQNQPKTLYLLRHAKSAWDNPKLSDFDRPLNKRGKENLLGLANVAAMLNSPPELIVTSPSRRTLDTSTGFCEGMSTLFKIEEEKELYHASKEEILRRIQKVPEKVQSLLIVGHNPGLEEFISWILLGSIVSIPLKMTTGSFVQMNLNVSLWSEMAPQKATLQLIIPGRFNSKLSI
ncbi:MAG: hypothetical protein HOA75_02150 [Deltaproteobacteria bacterium]|nr:hypothetical protein [Deltaproteobacteria bacterium]